MLHSVNTYHLIKLVKMQVLLYLLIILNIEIQAFTDFLENLDSFSLDEVQFCQLQIEIEDLWPVEGLHYFSSFSTDSCAPALIVKDFDSLDQSESCHRRIHFVKNHNETYLFLNINNINFSDDTIDFSKLPCILQNQPYFYIASKYGAKIVVDEVQVYSKNVVKVVEYVKIGSVWTLDRNSYVSKNARRSNFYGTDLLVHYSTNPKFGTVIDKDGNLKGFNGEISSELASKFNLTLNLTPLQNFGVKLFNGSFTGTVSQLEENEIDVGTYVNIAK